MLRVLIILLRLAVPILIVYGVWTVLRPKWAFTIVMDQTGMKSNTGVTTPEQRRLLELLRRTRFVEGQVKICGRQDENGKLQLKFFGQLSPETEQQIRNYIANEM